MKTTKTRAIRKGKINRHERITQILLSGNPVPPEEILLCLKDTDQEAVGYRIPTNIYNIRLDGGEVKVIKNGRKVQAYQLMNPQDFDKNGRFVLATKPVPTPVPDEQEEEALEAA